MSKYAGSEWTILGLALDYIAYKKKVNVFYLAGPCATDSGKSHWKVKHFQIWTNLKDLVVALPETYSAEDREIVLHNISNVMFFPRFSIVDMMFRSTLVDLRIKGLYNADVFAVYRDDLWHYGNFPPSIAYTIAKFPIPILKLYFSFYDSVRVLVRKFIHAIGPLNPNAQRGIPYA